MNYSNSVHKSKRASKTLLTYAVIMGLFAFSSLIYLQEPDVVRAESKDQASIMLLKPPEYIPGELIVKLKDPLLEEGQEQVKGISSGPEYELSKIYKIELEETASVEDAVAYLEQSPDVEYAEPNYIYSLHRTSNDTQFSDLWGMNNTGQEGGLSDADIDALEAWDINTGSSQVVVGVIDSGIFNSHPDLASNMWINEDEIDGNGVDDDNNDFIDDRHGCDLTTAYMVDDKIVCTDGDDGLGHGTHVAGTIGAVGNNNRGVVGVSWDVSIMDIKVFNDEGYTTGDLLALGTYYAAVSGAHITNNSYGGPSASQLEYDMINFARQQGVLTVVSSGNDGRNIDTEPSYPASYDLDNIISVGASDRNDNMAFYSNFGASSVDLIAPGSEIMSTWESNSYFELNGTSMASPHVAGVAALVKAEYPSWGYAQIKQAIMTSTDGVSAASGRTVTGGRLNAQKALASGITPTNTPTLTPTQTPTPTPTQSEFDACEAVGIGDSVCDNLINSLDYSIWHNAYKNGTYDERADFDLNGQIELNDFYVWFTNY